MKLITREEMQKTDRMAIEKRGISSLSLMENAGRGVAELIQKEFPKSGYPQVSVFCGKGNNGGDGFVIARFLKEWGYEVEVYILAAVEDYQGDALVNLNRLPFKPVSLLQEKDLLNPKSKIQNSHLRVDAIFGTGLDRPLTGFVVQLIRFLNESRKAMVSVDISSGLCANTGRALGEAIRATLTATLHLPKIGLVKGPDSERAGNIRVIPIGIPEELSNSIRRKEFLITPSLFQSFFKPRKRESHKNTYGHVLTIAGSRRKVGAGLMTARAALRAGAGLSTLALPECAYQKISPKFSEIMFEPQSDDGEYFSSSSLASLLRLVSKKSVIACGPGIGVSEELKKMIAGILSKVKIPCVLDADALNCLSEDLTPLKRKHPPCVLTPHPGEMQRLLSSRISEKLILNFSKKYRVILVLKAYRTKIILPTGEIFYNSTGNPGMATAGAGDVLTGIISGFIAQGVPILQAALAGVWIHGRAGDLVTKEKGERGLVAWDIAEKVPYVLKELIESTNPSSPPLELKGRKGGV